MGFVLAMDRIREQNVSLVLMEIDENRQEEKEVVVEDGHEEEVGH